MNPSAIDLSALGVEGLAYFLHRIPRSQLEGDAETLRIDIAKLKMKEAILNVLEAYFNDNPQEPPSPDLSLNTATSPRIDEVKQAVPPDNDTEPPALNTRETITSDKPSRRSKERGAVVERNNFIRQQNLDADNWLHRTEYEAVFVANGAIETDENVKEIVRGFLRRAMEDNVIVSVKAYAVASTNVVVTTPMYGLPSYLEDENAEKYRHKLRAKATDLGYFVTKEEALEHRDSKGGQIKLETH